MTEEEIWESLLIDFGRGKTIRDDPNDHEILLEISNPKQDDPRAQDLYDYGFLVKDLSRLWMEKTEVTRLPPLILDIIRQCVSEPQPTMREVVDIWERWMVVRATGVPVPDDISADEAWEDLDKTAWSSSFTRSVPSAQRGRLNSMFSLG